MTMKPHRIAIRTVATPNAASMVLASTALASLTVLAGCAGMPGGSPRAEAKLEPKSNSAVAGTVQFREGGAGVLARVKITGLAPNSEHGFHVHDKGDCSAPDASSAGGHFNPGGAQHGLPGSGSNHAGDLLNLKADAKGAVNAEVEMRGLTIGPGTNSIAGRAIVVHRDPDDYKSQPAGNSGPRVACGVIVAR
jgi:Cu-Zn family superoxide dismutase